METVKELSKKGLKSVEMAIQYRLDENNLTPKKSNMFDEIFESHKTESIEDFIRLCNSLIGEDEIKIGLIMMKYHDLLEKYLTHSSEKRGLCLMK